MRKLWLVLGITLLASTAVAAAAGTADSYFAGYSNVFTSGNDLVINGNNYYISDSGWFMNTGEHIAYNTDYIVGYCGDSDCNLGEYFHDYFSFDLSGLAGTVTSASFTVYTYTIQYDPGTLLLYGTSLSPSAVASGNSYSSVGDYNALVSGPLVGSISVSPSDSNTWVTATFNANGIAWLNTSAGGGAVLGGDFSEVPEPGSLMLLLLGTGVVSLAGAIRRVKG